MCTHTYFVLGSRFLCVCDKFSFRRAALFRRNQLGGSNINILPSSQTDWQPGKRQTAEQAKGPTIKGKDIGQDMLEGAGDADGDGEKATT